MTEPIALPFDSPAFASAWQEFEQHRREIRHKLTPTSTRRLLAKLKAWGEAQAIVALGLSVENGWRGVFEPPPPKSKPMEPENQKRERIKRERAQAEADSNRCKREHAHMPPLTEQLASRLFQMPEDA